VRIVDQKNEKDRPTCEKKKTKKSKRVTKQNFGDIDVEHVGKIVWLSCDVTIFGNTKEITTASKYGVEIRYEVSTKNKTQLERIMIRPTA